MSTTTGTIAAVQATPLFCDRDATIDEVGRLTKEAAGNGATLVAFPEAFVPTCSASRSARLTASTRDAPRA